MRGTRQLSSLRDLVKDEDPVHIILARIALHEGETERWFKTAEGHIAVSCKTHQHQAEINAILPTVQGSSKGIFGIPEIDTEVAIGFEGDYEGEAFVVAVYGGVIPALMDEAKLVIVGSQVCVTTPGGGSPEPLVKKSEMDGHTHGPGTYTAPSSGGSVTGTSGGADSITGTDALRGT